MKKSLFFLLGITTLGLFSSCEDEPLEQSNFHWRLDRNSIIVNPHNYARVNTSGTSICPTKGDDCYKPSTNESKASQILGAARKFAVYFDGDSTNKFFDDPQNESMWTVLFPNTWDTIVLNAFKTGIYKTVLDQDTSIFVYYGDLHSNPTFMYAIVPK